MEKLMETMLPTGAPIPAIASAAYSFAIEYSGPPLSFEIPKVIPIEIEQIPVATIATSACPTDSLPVVQPLPFKQQPFTQPEDFNSSGDLDATADGRRLSTDSSLISEEFDDFESSPSLDDDNVAENRAAGVRFQEASPSSRGERVERSLPRVKKGCCYRCSRGSWFMEKEACLVCDAKYCSDCVLKAMGSMPEGRKCVGCIGSPVEDSKSEKLGKSSRILRRLLSALEVEQVMKAEKYCEANQLRPEDIFVNRKQLTQEEMVLLHSCPCPLPKLKPGYYWYDKVSGFWGKEGHKPDKIISANLNVGGALMQNASNGNAGILINGREITKVELQMLKWSGVQCAGNPHLWVNADGSYQEEGQKNVKGNIWGKASTKLLCSFLSLPVPSKGGNLSGEEAHNMLNGALPNFFEQRTLRKFLLVGYDGSGSSTIFKQAKFLYENIPFSEDELENIKLLIQSNIYRYLGILLEGRERLEEESLAERTKNHPCVLPGTGNDVSDECDGTATYSISPRLKAFSDWLLKVMAAGNLDAIFPAATREYAPIVEELWKDAAIQATYSRIREWHLLPRTASYFLQKVVDISRVEYKPTDLDILYVDGITSSNGLACTEFVLPQAAASEGSGGDDAGQQDSLLRFQLIRIPTKSLGENCKWLDMFEDIRIVIFCVSLSDYDEYYEDASGVSINRMMEGKRLFESIITHRAFEHKGFLLILNKFDVLEEKIENSPLTLCEWFSDFNPISSCRLPKNSSSARNPNADATKAEQAFHYIAVKFKRLFETHTRRKLYVTSTRGLQSESVDAALRYGREILKWEEEKQPSTTDFSSYYESITSQ